MNKEVKTISRREFLKGFPQQLMKSIPSITCHLLNKDSLMDDTRTSSESKKALLDIKRCLAWSGASCQLCYVACPLRDQAIAMHDLKPVITSSFCNGCAMCVVACQTVNDLSAIKIST